MALSTIRAQLKTILSGVSGIGRIYDYKRFSNNWETYKDLFVKNSKVNEWEIQREGFDVEPRGSQAVQGKVKDTTHNLVLRGFYSFTDVPSSEKAFDTLVDAVTDTLLENQDVAGTAEIIDIPIAGNIFFAMFGDVLCHVVEIKFTLRERTFL